jgi:hypothetical protein
MKIFTAHWLRDLGLSCAAALLTGCAPMSGPGTFPGVYPNPAPGTYPPISYRPNPGGIPWYNVGYPRFPGNPYGPIVLNPRPNPGTPTPNPNPGTTPTIPVVLPGPAVPGNDSLNFWSPWPLPPRSNASTAAAPRSGRAEIKTEQERRTTRKDKPPEADHELRFASLQRGDGRQFDFFDDASKSGETGESADPNLKYHGGRTIRDLSYVNLYVSGDTRWSRAEVDRIDSRLAAAMQDQNLNNVLLQYFDNKPIRSTPLPSHPLVGYTPPTVTRGDIQNMIGWLHRQGFLKSFDLQNTVFNLLLPPGCVLTVDDRPSIVVSDEVASSVPGASSGSVPPSEDGDSRDGLAGYHGSVATANNDRVYYTVSVYSQPGANNSSNGIPIFRESWRNVVATLYHQLIESRTNPDVEEAMRRASDANAKQYLGWVSDSGLEIGDTALRSNAPLRTLFQEVPLADGRGVVPVQLPWSNAAQGPEGPISQPHPLP